MENVLKNALVAINQILEGCPECHSDQVKNKSPHPSSGHTKMTCKECGHEWTESSLAMNKEAIENVLKAHGLFDEADAIRDMGMSAYKELISENLDLHEFLH